MCTTQSPCKAKSGQKIIRQIQHEATQCTSVTKKGQKHHSYFWTHMGLPFSLYVLHIKDCLKMQKCKKEPLTINIKELKFSYLYI